MVDEQAALDLVAVHMPSFREAVIAELTKNLSVKGPFRPHGQTGAIIVDAGIADHRGGITTFAQFSAAEVLGLAQGVLPKLVELRGKQAGEDIFYMLMNGAARSLAWQRACFVAPDETWWQRHRRRAWGRWKRLKWAWRGHIPIDP